MENRDVNNNLNNGNDAEDGKTAFSYMKEKVRSNTGKKFRRACHVVGLSFVAAIVFGFTAKAVFVWSGPLFGEDKKQQNERIEDQGQEAEVQRNEVLIGTKETPAGAASETSNSQKQTKPSKTPTKPPIVSPTKEPTDTPPADDVSGQSETSVSVGPEDPDAAGSDKSEAPAGSADAADASKDASTSDKAEITGEPADTAEPDGENTADGEASSAEGSDAAEADGGIRSADNADDRTDAADESPLRMYARMMAEMKNVANYVKHSVTEVRAINGGVNWLDENIETQTTHTGTIVGNNGIELLILTCFDEIAAADRIEVEFEDGFTADAKLYGMYGDMDIAIVAVTLSTIPEDTMNLLQNILMGDSKNVAEGEPVIAIGATNGYFGSLNFGFVTAEGMKAYVFDGSADLFTLDIDYHKDADGVIVNLDGELIGLITDKLGNADSGVCTVVGIDSLVSVLYKMANRLKIPYLGIRAENIPEKILEGMGIENGIYVNEVASGSPAALAGIRKGDVIRNVNEQAIGSVEEYSAMLSDMKINDKLIIEVYRSSAAETSIRLSARVTGK